MLLGSAMIFAQRVEFILYGIVSHLSHLPEAKKEKRFRDLTPEKFLVGDRDALKATLGQLLEKFGDRLMINSPDINEFCDKRNTIAHNYVREFRLGSRGKPPRKDGVDFLVDFVLQARKVESVLQGLMLSLMEAAAKMEGREGEIVDTLKDGAHHLEAFAEHLLRNHIASKDEAL